jgi:hypothetical protein
MLRSQSVEWLAGATHALLYWVGRGCQCMCGLYALGNGAYPERLARLDCQFSPGPPGDSHKFRSVHDCKRP